MSNSRFAGGRAFVWAALGVGLLLIAVGLSACGPTAGELYEQRLATADKPAVHAVTAAKLRELMHSLEFDPLPDPDQAIPMAAREEKIRQASGVAAKMADTAKYIAPLADELGLKGQDKELFVKLSAKLEVQSRELSEQLAGGGRAGYQDANRQINQMQATCQACHVLFRPAGSVDFGPRGK